MVFSREHGVTGGRREEFAGSAREKANTRSLARQSRFHNFSFPTMSWGSQRILRCVNLVSGIGGSAAGSTAPETRIDPRNERHALSSPFSPLLITPNVDGSKEKEAELEEASSATAEEAAAAVDRPWNLRTRRAACYAPSENGRNWYPSSSPSTNPLSGKDNPGKAGMLRSVVGENGQRREFSVSLSHEEIIEDFYAFKGTKPNRRPKKRARIVQRQLDALFPGLWLSEVTTDEYKVVE